MPIDPTRLSQSELLQVLNSTPAGQVLTRWRLRRQMDAAGLRIGDGTHIHLARYVRWLIDELEKPRPAKVDYAEARRRQAERNRAATKASQDIAPIPQSVFEKVMFTSGGRRGLTACRANLRPGTSGSAGDRGEGTSTV